MGATPGSHELPQKADLPAFTSPDKQGRNFGQIEEDAEKRHQDVIADIAQQFHNAEATYKATPLTPEGYVPQAAVDQLAQANQTRVARESAANRYRETTVATAQREVLPHQFASALERARIFNMKNENFIAKASYYFSRIRLTHDQGAIHEPGKTAYRFGAERKPIAAFFRSQVDTVANSVVVGAWGGLGGAVVGGAIGALGGPGGIVAGAFLGAKIGAIASGGLAGIGTEIGSFVAYQVGRLKHPSPKNAPIKSASPSTPPQVA